jgi:hypothetical protein
MLEKLFESLDEKVFTSEMKIELTESFNAAVELKAAELAEAKIDALEEKAEELKVQLEEEYKAKEASLLEQVDSYLEKVVEDFVVEGKESLETSLVNEKADLMIEAFDAMLVAGGVEVSKIVEAKDSEDVETKLAESIEKYDALVEENIALEKEKANLIKMGVIMEMKEGLSLVEAEKFAKLAELVEFSNDANYTSKLETLKESIKGAKETVVTEAITEVVAKKSVYSHLV